MATLIASSALVIGGGLWYVFRRTAPNWKKEDLPSSVHESIDVVSELNDEERTAVFTAFLSGDDFRWLVAGKDFKTNLDEKQHVKATSYMVNCCLVFAERYGHILVSRDENGKFEGALALIAPYASSSLFMAHFLRSVLPLGMPVVKQMGEGVSARFDAFTQMADRHKEIMKDTAHWYVQVLAVSDDAQGKGVGRKLMNAAIAIAGETPLYLECHDGNVPIYKKYGYTQARRYFLTPKGIEDKMPFPYNGMVYGI